MIERSIDLRLGTRGSALALIQTEIVQRLLQTRFPAITLSRVVIKTAGDIDKTSPLTEIGGRGVFTSALEAALCRREIDAAIHSAKDLPTQLAPAFSLVAFPERDDPRDVLVSRHRCGLRDLPDKPIIATSSRRRACQILLVRPDARIVDLRGNVDTRLAKALAGDLDGIVLAAAGVIRMGRAADISEYFDVETFVPSPGQGALAIEIRTDDDASRALLETIDRPEISEAVRVERAFLRAVGSGCTLPIGAHAIVKGDRVELVGMVSDGETRSEFAREWFDQATAEHDAADLARTMLKEIGPDTSALTTTTSPVQPLRCRRVLITRDAEDAIPFQEALTAAGAIPVVLPAISIQDTLESEDTISAAVRDVVAGHYDWIVVTSRHAVERFFGHVVQPVSLGRTKIAAVGPSTAARLSEFGLAADLVSPVATAAGLVEALSHLDLRNSRILFPCGDLASNAIEDGLSALGARVDRIVVYRTVPETNPPAGVIDLLRRNRIEVVTFMSPSSVSGLMAMLEGNDVPFPQAAVACIGPVTAAAARDAGLCVDIMATESTADGLVKSIIEWHTQRDSVAPNRKGLIHD